jgi:uncharacterized protein (DUF433 family)
MDLRVRQAVFHLFFYDEIINAYPSLTIEDIREDIRAALNTD